MMSNKKLKPCFCGRTPEIVTRDVEPQEDRFFSGKTIMFVLCECGQCLFDGAFHEGFSDEEDAANAWNYRVTPSPVPASVVEALGDAASSLEAIGRDAGRDEFMGTFPDIRGYANNRAAVARAAYIRSLSPNTKEPGQ